MNNEIKFVVIKNHRILASEILRYIGIDDGYSKYTRIYLKNGEQVDISITVEEVDKIFEVLNE